jgi:hypothetical protein
MNHTAATVISGSTSEPQTCILQHSADYRCDLSLRALDAPTGHAELLITSQWAGARHPHAPQVRFKAVLDADGLESLRTSLVSFLDSQSHTSER